MEIDAKQLARLEGWSEEVYRDLLAVESGHMTEAAFDEKYLTTKAVLVLDVTGFTTSTIHGGAIGSFLRILDAQKICAPVLHKYGASCVRAFADDLIAVFDEGGVALDAALEIQREASALDASKHVQRPECCIGIGFGSVYAIGPNHAMGDEMNQASKLGEEIARGGEILVTENAFRALEGRADVRFESQTVDDLLFPYYRVRLS